MFTREELQNIIALINSATIKGQDSVVVANLLVKISNLMAEMPKQDEQSKEGNKEEPK